jgi:hypothetical protein
MLTSSRRCNSRCSRPGHCELHQSVVSLDYRDEGEEGNHLLVHCGTLSDIFKDLDICPTVNN